MDQKVKKVCFVLVGIQLLLTATLPCYYLLFKSFLNNHVALFFLALEIAICFIGVLCSTFLYLHAEVVLPDSRWNLFHAFASVLSLVTAMIGTGIASAQWTQLPDKGFFILNNGIFFMNQILVPICALVHWCLFSWMVWIFSNELDEREYEKTNTINIQPPMKSQEKFYHDDSELFTLPR